MGKLTRSAGRMLGAGIVVLAGAGIVVLAGAGIANARPASTSACDKIFATFDSLNVMQTKHPHSWGPVIAAVAEFTQDASTGSPAVKTPSASSSPISGLTLLRATSATGPSYSRTATLSSWRATHIPAALPPRAAAARPTPRMLPCSAWAGPLSWPASASSAWPGAADHRPARVTASGRAGPGSGPAMAAWTRSRLVAVVTGMVLIASGG